MSIAGKDTNKMINRKFDYHEILAIQQQCLTSLSLSLPIANYYNEDSAAYRYFCSVI
jgi:hypothetical protein